MYNTLGGKVDSLSETDLLEELEKLALVKTVTVVQAVDYPAMITKENPVQQPTAHSSPTRAHDQPALAMGNIANMTMNSTITELCYQYPAMISVENPVQQPTAHRNPALSCPTHSSQPHSSPAHTHNQPALAKRSIANMTTDSTITKPCYQCGKMTHTDKTLADQCRLMMAIASVTMDHGPVWRGVPHRQDVG
jgi:hypothetical protein